MIAIHFCHRNFANIFFFGKKNKAIAIFLKRFSFDWFFKLICSASRANFVIPICCNEFLMTLHSLQIMNSEPLQMIFFLVIKNRKLCSSRIFILWKTISYFCFYLCFANEIMLRIIILMTDKGNHPKENCLSKTLQIINFSRQK